jgi:phospholipid/cholesterol/gamma-HCH transport system permease protein
VDGLGPLERRLDRLRLGAGPDWQLDTTAVTQLDSGGALLLHRLLERLSLQGIAVSLGAVPAGHVALLELVRGSSQVDEPPPRPLSPLERLGKRVVHTSLEIYGFLIFIGEMAVQALPALRRPHRIRWRQVTAEMSQAGVKALPIVGLLAFLVGIVIAYQGGTPLREYGANIFIVELVAITILREMAPLVTAIIVAGRTGSSYTAEIGTMQITEEVDALRTMGITPFEMLVLPKLIALVLALPLLTVFADILGLFGGMLVADSMFGVGINTFLERMPSRLDNSHFWLGVVKAPVFAAIIASVGCFHGFRVEGSAERVGRATTTSVVQSIFLVIVADAAFSILFNLAGL